MNFFKEAGLAMLMGSWAMKENFAGPAFNIFKQPVIIRLGGSPI